MSYFVNALGIRQWADRVGSRYTLPQVIRRLVSATVKEIIAVDFPAQESAQRSGFDGEIDCVAGNAWVPSGRSVWEMGVNRDVKGKADDDFLKRTAETPEQVQQQKTYVAVTPRHWENKDEWVAEQKSNGKWKDVRAYDADDLEQWTETAPAVGIWLGRELGTRPEDVDTIDAKWEMLSMSTVKLLLPEVFLGSREKQIQAVDRWLSEKPSLLFLETRSPTEGVDFFAAYVASREEGSRESLASKVIVIESLQSWKMVRDAKTSAVLVVDPSIALMPEEIARAIGNGHHVLMCGEPSRGPVQNVVNLERAGQFELAKALKACGFSPIESQQHARASAGSLAVLKRRLAQYPTSFIPTWAPSTADQPIRASLLIGGWDERNADDCKAVERIASVSYQDLETQFQRLSVARDPLLLHADGKWRVISKDEAWATVGDRVSAASLAEFEKLAVEILSDDDPRYELAEGERHLAQVMGHVPKYSATIKKHVAETLAMLGSLGKTINAADAVDVTASVDRIVAALL